MSRPKKRIFSTQESTIKIKGILINYTEVNPHLKITLIFIHGNSSSSRAWIKQLESSVFEKFRLIAIDLPAHGNSGSSIYPERDYNLKTLGKITGEAICALTDGNEYILIGISLGSNILAEALPYLSPRGIVIAGSCLIGGNITLGSFTKTASSSYIGSVDDATEFSIKRYGYQSMMYPKLNDIARFTSDYNRVKNPFRSYLNTSLEKNRYSDQLSLVVNTGLPLLIIFGERDAIINPHYLDHIKLKLWKNKIHNLPNAGHLVNIDQAGIFNTLLRCYADEVLYHYYS